MRRFVSILFPLVAFWVLSCSISAQTLPPGENVLWRDPGDVSALNFVDGVGGPENAPAVPFQFIDEDMSGTAPKMNVRDAKGRMWNAKFGEEAKPSVFSTRLVWACGYNVETEYFVAHGQVQGAGKLKRLASFIKGDGRFSDARFQARTDSPKFLKSAHWSWNSNPFLGTPQLQGLKILTMLLSNWDLKDARDFDPGSHSAFADSNLGIFEQDDAGRPTYLFTITDWGAALGKWGGLTTRSKSNCRDYVNQTSGFVQGVNNGVVRWGWAGKHRDDIVKNITVPDVAWLLKYLGQVTDQQIRRGLASSGEAPDEMECYTFSIRHRIAALQAVAQ